MDVFLIPVGQDAYRLYSELPAVRQPLLDELPAPGRLGRVAQRVRGVIASLDHETEPDPDHPDGWRERLRRRIARRVGEQRLLWRLRGEEAATIVCPDDCPAALAVELVRAELKRDGDRHRVWLVVDALAFLASGLLMLLPGPNVVAYYFAFSLAGHYLSLRGARQGRQRVRWSVRPDASLTDLRRAMGLPGAERDRRVHEIARRLNLPHLPGFFARAALRSA
ncbi:MAG: hypothetical protein KGN76_12550 [Acidobacteriota bacterium]|nr:hypothetical protein [Acidobacteriota bacterium]